MVSDIPAGDGKIGNFFYSVATAVYLPAILETLGRDRKLKPWMTNGEDLEKELKRLGLRKEDLRLDKKPLVLDPANNIVDRVGYSFPIF